MFEMQSLQQGDTTSSSTLRAQFKRLDNVSDQDAAWIFDGV